MRRWFRFLTLVACLLVFVSLAGCSRKVQVPWQPAEPKYEFSATPEKAVEGFIREVNAGEYGRAARYFWEAPEVWQRDPLMWKSVIETRTYGREIEQFEQLSSTQKADSATLSGWLYLQGHGKRQGGFALAKKPEGWILISIR